MRTIFPIQILSKNTYTDKQYFTYKTNYLLEIYF